MNYNQSELRNWAMLATDYDDIRSPIIYPVLVQEKLNGVRAKWDGEKQLFISRNGEIWPEHILPDLYFSHRRMTKSFDGELYSYDLSFQEITQAVSVNRLTPHPNAIKVGFFVFDIINDEVSQERLRYAVCQPYKQCNTIEEVFDCLKQVRQRNGEGIIIRQRGCPYIPGRTEALIKLKPWITQMAEIVGMNEGLGKNHGSLGALIVELTNGIQVKVGGGPGLSDECRKNFWNNKNIWLRKSVVIRYRELSDTGVPLQPQICYEPN